MLSLIVAVTDNDVIGNKGAIPWSMPADMAYFKQTTMDHSVIMGRKTYESIGRALPGRYNVVITRQKGYRAARGCVVVHSLAEALSLPKVKTDPEPFVIGGSEIYNQALPLADRIYLTQIHTEMEGDTLFKFDQSQWQEVSRQEHKADAQNKYAYDFFTLSRAV